MVALHAKPLLHKSALGLAAHVSAPATETVLNKEGGMSETGCDSLADKDKVLEAIALFTNQTSQDIECIENKVQVRTSPPPSICFAVLSVM